MKKMKLKSKILSGLLALMMMVGILPMSGVTTYAAELPTFSGGSGTQTDPYFISTAEDLKVLADTVNSGTANYQDHYFKQTADLDLSAFSSWDPIGYSGSFYFAGHYDGDNFAIKNITSTGKIDADGYATAGIFGWSAFGSIRNLQVVNANVVATGQKNYAYAGGLAAVTYGSTIDNCFVGDSVVESRRESNNNSAGGLIGYGTGTTVTNCGVVNTRVTSQAYAGGFVGELDADYAGPSTFTNCYVAESTVTASTLKVNGSAVSGGFCGATTVGVLDVTNSYLYHTAVVIGADNLAAFERTGGFSGYLHGKSTIKTTNCYYGGLSVTEEMGTAEEKTETEFQDGTVNGLLGEAFAQGTAFPLLKTAPADYTAVNQAVAKAQALHTAYYVSVEAVTNAVDAVVYRKTVAEQAEVNGYAKAINDAIAALQYKPADYTEVDNAIATANTLNPSDYTNFTEVTTAIQAVVRDKNITEQAIVDGYAKAIKDAIAALQHIPIPAPIIIEGMNQKIQMGQSATFKSTAPFVEFVTLLVDGKEVAKSHYGVGEGSTVVTLSATYLQTLQTGQHSLDIVSENGTASTTFTIVATTSTPSGTVSGSTSSTPLVGPDTGDSGMTGMLVLVSTLALAGILLTIRVRRTK